MKQPILGRREVLLAGASLVATAALPGLAQAAAPGVMIFESGLAGARGLALQQRRPGQPLVGLEGDPIRFWRDRLQIESGPVSGVTRWSAFLAISEAAKDQRRRVRREASHPQEGGPLLVSWTLA